MDTDKQKKRAMSRYTKGIRTKNLPVTVMPRAAKLIKDKLASTSSFPGCKKTGMGVGMRPTFVKF